MVVGRCEKFLCICHCGPSFALVRERRSRRGRETLRAGGGVDWLRSLTKAQKHH